MPKKFKTNEILTNEITKIIDKMNEGRSVDDKISINKMAIELNISYAGLHRLINREDLSTTPLGTLNNIANYLGVEVRDLYEKDGER